MINPGVNDKPILLLYSTYEGQTFKIMRHLSICLENEGFVVVLHNLKDQPPAPNGYSLVVLGSSIRYGHFHSVFRRYILEHAKSLNAQLTAFVAVNLTARKANKSTPQTNGYTRKFLAKSLWQPTLCLVAAGALRYARYTWYDRFMIRLIMRLTQGETNVAANVEYTNWSKVDAFAQDLIEILRPSLKKTPFVKTGVNA